MSRRKHPPNSGDFGWTEPKSAAPLPMTLLLRARMQVAERPIATPPPPITVEDVIAALPTIREEC